jgi:V8-like Glu-specific endopeptidase
MIKYINFETLPGMSGSPVVIKDQNDNLKIIGINCNNNFGIYFSK